MEQVLISDIEHTTEGPKTYERSWSAFKYENSIYNKKKFNYWY